MKSRFLSALVLKRHALSASAMVAIALLALSGPSHAQMFPRSAIGMWCSSPDPSSPDFFIESAGARMGDIKCKLTRISSDQGSINANLMCTNFTGRYVEPMSVKVFSNNTLIQQGGDYQAVLKKCRCGANYDRFC